MTKQLLPDPPLGDLPTLPDDLRWNIEPPSKIYDIRDLRRVSIQKKVVKSFLWWAWEDWEDAISPSIWDVKGGLGDFSLATPERWWQTEGLACTTGHLLEKYRKSLVAGPDYSDVYGVSKQ